MTRYVRKGEEVPWYKGLAARIILPAIIGTAMFSNTNKVLMPKYFHNPDEQKQVGYMAAKPATELEKRIIYPQNKPETNLESIIREADSKSNIQKTQASNKQDSIEITTGDQIIYNNLEKYASKTLLNILSSQLILHTSKGVIKTRILKDTFPKVEDAYYTLEGIIAEESSGDPNAENSHGAYGLGQITKYALADYNQIVDQYHPELINEITGERIKLQKYTMKDMKDPKKNSIVMAMYLNHLEKIIGGDIIGILTYYSGNKDYPGRAIVYVNRAGDFAKKFRLLDKIKGRLKEKGIYFSTFQQQ